MGSEPLSASSRGTVFLTAVRVIGTSPHHLNPAIMLCRRGGALRVVAPADPPGHFETGSLIERAIPEDAWRFVSRGRDLVSRLTWYLRSWRVARRALSEINADQLYIYGAQVCLVAILLLPAMARGTRVIYHTQDFLEPHRLPFRAWLEARICRRAEHVIVNERNRGRVLQSLYGLKQPPRVVPTGLLTDWNVPERSIPRRDWLLSLAPTPPSIDEDPVLIVHQGPLRANRCGFELLTALAALPVRYRLVVTGMDRAALEGMTSAHCAAIADRVLLPGDLAFQDMLEVTASCDLGVLLYPNDGIGNFYQAPGRFSENGRAGIPSIASAFPPFELITAQHGFLALCDPADPSDIARALAELGERSPEQRAALGNAARAYSLDALAFDRHFSETLEEIDSA